MSSDKNLVPKCISKNSDSFDNRICDDLSEVLLQFLPLKDKPRLECVSKQFQRTVFVKQYEICLYSSLKLNEEVTEGFVEDINIIYIIEDNIRNYIQCIESVLKKCPNVQRMNICTKNRIFKSIVPLITKYCHNLNEFNVDSNEWTEPKLNEEFHQKFSLKLKYIRCGKDLDFNLYPNLHSLDKYIKFKLGLSFPESVLPLNLKKLKELNITLTEQNKHLLREVLQKFHKLRHLGLYLYTDLQKSVSNAFKESAVLQNLIQLKYNTNSAKNGNQFLNSLKHLSKKFPKLKSFEIESVLMKDFPDLRQQLSPLKAFPDLKRLNLWLNLQHEIDQDMFSLKAFEELSYITHLRLRFDVKLLNEKILTNIDIYLPKLQYLFIRRKISTDEEGVTQMAESLSRLSSLHTIDLWLTYGHISELMNAKIIEKCRKIKTIRLYNWK